MREKRSDGVVRHFMQEWDDYDRQIRQAIPFYDQALATLLRVVRQSVAAPKRILDLGVGTGVLAQLLLDACPEAHLIGVDLARSYLELAEQRLAAHRTRVSLQEEDVVEFDFESSHYDLIVTSFVFHHASDADKRLLYGKIRDALLPGGCFINADFVDSGSRYWSAVFDEIRIDHMRQSGWSEDEIERRYVEHRKLESPAPVEVQLEWLRESGFMDVECFWKYLNLALFGGRRQPASIV